MFKVFFLMFESPVAWEKIAQAQRGILFVLLTYLLPWVLLVSVAEAWSLQHWGKWQPEFAKFRMFTAPMAERFVLLQGIFFIVMVFASAGLLHVVSKNFSARHRFAQTFALAAYGCSPFFLFHLLNLSPKLHPVVGWIVGALVCVFILYQGVPRVLRAEATHAFGIYFSAIFILLFTSALVRIFTGLYLLGNVNFQASPLLRALGQWLNPAGT